MERIDKAQLLPPRAEEMQPATDRRIAAASGSVALVTVPAAWPAGVSALALAVNAYQRRDFQLDRLLRSANKNVPPTAFCD